MEKYYDTKPTEWTPRPPNVSYEPNEGDVWVFFDAEDEGAVEWKVDKISEGFAELTKLTGKDVGFRRNYETWKLVQGTRWKPKADAESQVLFNCPSCGGAKPIRVGDYMCTDCRVGLDNS